MRLLTPHNDASSVSKLSPDFLASLLPNEPDWADICYTVQVQYIAALLNADDILKAEGISTELRLAHFLGQGLIESNFFRATEENLNYSAVALRATWPGRFPTDELAEEYARQPEKIANFVYANRMENGDEASGDGWRYRGRGIIQLTGRQNYRIFGDLLGLPLEDDPDILTRDFRAALHVAAKFFSENNLLALADADDAKKISRAINRGNANSSSPAHGEDDRIWWTAKALDLFRKEEDDLLNPREGGKLTIGHKGARVEEFQRMLAALGFAVGGFDGDFGPATQRAVIAFQQQADLPVTGVIDKATALAMDEALTGQPTPNNRVNADENTVRETGSETPDDTNQIAAAGVAAGVAAAAAAASELLDGEEEAAPTTNTETQTPQTPPTTSGGVNWILIGCLLIVVVAVTVIFLRARKIKKDQVKDYQEGKIV